MATRLTILATLALLDGEHLTREEFQHRALHAGDTLALEFAPAAAAHRRHAQLRRPRPLAAARTNEVERLVHRARTDEDRNVEFVQPVEQLENRPQIRQILDLDRREHQRVAAGCLDQRREPLRLLARARHQNAASRERSAAHSPATRSARISAAPCARSCAATSFPTRSGSAASPSRSARAMRRPSGEATSARKRRRAPSSSA